MKGEVMDKEVINEKIKMQFGKVIKKLVEDNCKRNKYILTFSPDYQKVIRANSERIAEVTLGDENLFNTLDEFIEEAIRVFIICEDDLEKKN